MSTTAQAVVLEAPRTLARRALPLPTVGDHDGLLRIEACGLCGTDHEQYTGLLFGGFGFVPGHEIVGVVEAAGDAACRRWGVEVGQRVAVEVFQSCQSCEPCRSGEYRRCQHHGLADMFGFVAVDREPGLWGGYATHLFLPADALLLPVPDGLDPVLATVFNPLGAGLRWAATLPATGTGDVVAVLGPGIRGLAGLVAAREAGAGFVMVTGFGPPDRSRLEVATKFGADLVVDVAREDPVAALRRVAGRLADVVVDVTAKAPAALGQAVELARPGATVVLAGTRGSEDTPGFRPDQVVAKELRLVGALGVDRPAYLAALDLLAAERYPFADLPRRVVGFKGLEDLLQTMAGEGEAAPPLHGVFVPTPE